MIVLFGFLTESFLREFQYIFFAGLCGLSVLVRVFACEAGLVLYHAEARRAQRDFLEF